MRRALLCITSRKKASDGPGRSVRVLIDRSGVVFEPPESWLRRIINSIHVLDPHRDATGVETLVSWAYPMHLTKARRGHLWRVLQQLRTDMQVSVRGRTRLAVRLLLGLSVAAYGGLMVMPSAQHDAALGAVLSVAGLFLGLAALTLPRVLQPCWQERRRIILGHGRCPCCLAEVCLKNQRAGVVTCDTCSSTWAAWELPDPGVSTAVSRCAACAYDTHATAGACPECGSGQPSRRVA